ncbi:MAG TPA: TetR family transcriptional regulator [Acidimicrobiia bacterium]|jgi:AcrR family transcriptional regulator
MSPTAADLTGAARIREAAMARFPRDGFEGTTVRAIAEDAGVSPALVVHHFGSKKELRAACDAYVIDRIRSVKEDAITSGKLDDPATISGGFQMAPPLIRYLGWALASGSAAAAGLFDEMVDESMRLSELAEEQGAMEPSTDLRARCALQIAMQMGALAMQDHLERALGVDLLSPEGVMRMSRATLELFSGGMFPPGQAEAMRKALDTAIENTRKEGSDG